MAYLVRAINPWCRLFPVRVGTLQKDIVEEAAIKVCIVPQSTGCVADNVCQAIQWAIARQVDVISISWVLAKSNPKLREVIQQAVEDHNILVYCSTADTGSKSHPDVYPANYEGLVTAVSASNH